MIKDNTAEEQPGHEMTLMATHTQYNTIKSLLKFTKLKLRYQEGVQ